MTLPLEPRQESALFDLLTAVGPSGHEEAVAEVVTEQALTAGLYADRDAMGNVIVSLQELARGARPTQPVVLLDAHIDEIGFVVTHVTDEGLLHFKEIGGWDPTVFVGQRVVIRTNRPVTDNLLGGHHMVEGVVGREATHLQEKDSCPKVKDLWIDIGAKDKDDAASLVSVGDVGVLNHADGPVFLPNGRIASRALDDRLGAFVILEVLREYKRRDGALNLMAAFTVQEEVGLRGARVAAQRLNPQVAIAIDVTHCTDAGDVPEAVHGVHPLGGGPVILTAAYHSQALYRHLKATAARHEIVHGVEASGGSSGTNADSIQFANAMHSGVVSIPLRHMHSPSEVASLGDALATVRLLVEAILELPSELYRQ